MALKTRQAPSSVRRQWPLALRLLYAKRYSQGPVVDRHLADLHVVRIFPESTVIASNKEIQIDIQDLMGMAALDIERHKFVALQEATGQLPYTPRVPAAAKITWKFIHIILGQLSRLGNVILHGEKDYLFECRTGRWAVEEPINHQAYFVMAPPQYSKGDSPLPIDTCVIPQPGRPSHGLISAADLFSIFMLARERYEEDEDLQEYVVRVLTVRESSIRRLRATLPRSYIKWLLQEQDSDDGVTVPEMTIEQSPYFEVGTLNGLEQALHLILE